MTPGERDERGWCVDVELQDGVSATADMRRGPRFVDLLLDDDGLEVNNDPNCVGTIPLDVLFAVLERAGYTVTKREAGQ